MCVTFVYQEETLLFDSRFFKLLLSLINAVTYAP